MLNSVPSSSLYSSIGGLFLFLSGGSGAQNGGATALAAAVTAVAGIAVVAAVVYTRRGHLKSPWSRKRRKHALTLQQWRNSFTPDGKLLDGGLKLLKKEYEKLRRQSRRLLKQTDESVRLNSNGKNESPITDPSSPASEDVVSARDSLSSERGSSDFEYSENNSSSVLDRTNSSRRVTSTSPSVIYSDSSDLGSSDDEQLDEASPSSEHDDNPDVASKEDLSPAKSKLQSNACCTEDFASWQRIIRLDAVRANAEWMAYSPSQAAVSEDRANRSAEAVGLKDYDHLEPCRIYHAARLVAILEAYAIYDSEIGYCQGMSDLLSPILSVIEEDHMAFWCFVGFMKKARHNFRLDEVGIRRQLNIVAKIIQNKDSHLYRHLVQLQAEDCFFVYRMVVVLFRRELNFEQTLCLWEVMWADQAALRAGIGKSAWSRIRQRAPPTEDLLLYAIAASVLQRRKQIIEKYSSMDEILRECNSMAGHLDVWKLLDGAHDLVMTLHDKIGTNL
ncbi:GTPase-activating protein gyp7 [Bienertia sinuspersici]